MKIPYMNISLPTKNHEGSDPLENSIPDYQQPAVTNLRNFIIILLTLSMTIKIINLNFPTIWL